MLRYLSALLVLFSRMILVLKLMLSFKSFVVLITRESMPSVQLILGMLMGDTGYRIQESWPLNHLGLAHGSRSSEFAQNKTDVSGRIM